MPEHRYLFVGVLLSVLTKEKWTWKECDDYSLKCSMQGVHCQELSLSPCWLNNCKRRSFPRLKSLRCRRRPLIITSRRAWRVGVATDEVYDEWRKECPWLCSGLMYNLASRSSFFPAKPWECYNHEFIKITSIAHCVHARTHISDKQSKQNYTKNTSSVFHQI